MKTTCLMTAILLDWCTLNVILSHTTSFETFDPGECMKHVDDRTLFRKSYMDCVKSCKKMDDCIGIGYFRRQLRCRYHFGSDAMKRCHGYAQSMKSKWTQKDDECTCPSRKTCNKNGVCVFSECTKLQERAHGKLYGNMAGIGNKVILKCHPGYVLNQPGALVCQDDGQWSGENTVCIEDPACTQSLVDRVEDGQLSESSYWCQNEHAGCAIADGLTAKFARLSSTGRYTGCWAAGTYRPDEYIQVDFLEERVISGVVLKGRNYMNYLPPLLQQYVTKFKLLISSDCSTFETIQDESGQSKVFVGNTRPARPDNSEKVTRYLAERVVARCVRINPIDYANHISLRFDVLGC